MPRRDVLGRLVVEDGLGRLIRHKAARAVRAGPRRGERTLECPRRAPRVPASVSHPRRAPHAPASAGPLSALATPHVHQHLPRALAALRVPLHLRAPVSTLATPRAPG